LCELAATTRGLANAWVRSGVLRVHNIRTYCVCIDIFILLPVLRIHEALVGIRISRSIPLTNGSGCGSGSCYFRQ
jgi:hypothetical protein